MEDEGDSWIAKAPYFVAVRQGFRGSGSEYLWMRRTTRYRVRLHSWLGAGSERMGKAADYRAQVNDSTGQRCRGSGMDLCCFV